MEAAAKKARSAYAKYEIARDHAGLSKAMEDIFRKGFVMGYHTALDEIERERAARNDRRL